MVGWRAETVPCRGRHLGEKDFLAISVRMIARSSRATLVSLRIISLQIADIMAATELEQPSMAGYDVTEGRYKGSSKKTENKFSNPQNYPGRVPGPSEGRPQPPLR